MKTKEIVDAIIEVGRALESQKMRREEAKRERENIDRRRDVGYPVGTKVYSFCCEDGIEEFVVVGRQMVSSGGVCRFCVEDDRFSLSPIEAIRNEVEYWRTIGELDAEADIEHFQFYVDYHSERVEWAKMAIDAIKEVASK